MCFHFSTARPASCFRRSAPVTTPRFPLFLFFLSLRNLLAPRVKRWRSFLSSCPGHTGWGGGWGGYRFPLHELWMGVVYEAGTATPGEEHRRGSGPLNLMTASEIPHRDEESGWGEIITGARCARLGSSSVIRDGAGVLLLSWPCYIITRLSFTYRDNSPPVVSAWS